MSTDVIWQAFAETGDPVYYLLYKSVADKAKVRQKKAENSGENVPAAEA